MAQHRDKASPLSSPPSSPRQWSVSSSPSFFPSRGDREREVPFTEEPSRSSNGRPALLSATEKDRGIGKARANDGFSEPPARQTAPLPDSRLQRLTVRHINHSMRPLYLLDEEYPLGYLASNPIFLGEIVIQLETGDLYHEDDRRIRLPINAEEIDMVTREVETHWHGLSTAATTVPAPQSTFGSFILRGANPLYWVGARLRNSLPRLPFSSQQPATNSDQDNVEVEAGPFTRRGASRREQTTVGPQGRNDSAESTESIALQILYAHTSGHNHVDPMDWGSWALRSAAERAQQPGAGPSRGRVPFLHRDGCPSDLNDVKDCVCRSWNWEVVEGTAYDTDNQSMTKSEDPFEEGDGSTGDEDGDGG
ncbi:hypothetical protein EJ08DRAFT_659198 [Tothia fuscella]|uniref:Uncharacterized protein n=1 Tax=Tothia fuscella TaxID=1048955 RepID=A0A9P4U083_9PEZI|nr:hypothetical protein EJ08DRAFT_659198 [Tothia fuscella]